MITKRKPNKIAVMQPYFFPYIGYFQLIDAVDKFVFYDDVTFIKSGWINRNRALVGGKPIYLTASLEGASSSKLINEINLIDNRAKLKKTIQMAYKKAPYYEQVWQAIEPCFDMETNGISELAMKTVKTVCEFIGVETEFEISSIDYANTKGLERQKRLIEICRMNEADTYINASGGKALYTKEEFRREGIDLYFLESSPIAYKQFRDEFVPNLSIIDVMMFNSLEVIHQFLKSYELL